jgi:hypothetical protein
MGEGGSGHKPDTARIARPSPSRCGRDGNATGPQIADVACDAQHRIHQSADHAYVPDRHSPGFARIQSA